VSWKPNEGEDILLTVLERFDDVQSPQDENGKDVYPPINFKSCAHGIRNETSMAVIKHLGKY
jgi:hypothetical protein